MNQTRSTFKAQMKEWDQEVTHSPYQLERKLMSEIQLAMADEAILTLNEINSRKRASLSSEPIRSLKNSLIASCTLFTRAMIEGGVDPESAYSQSDLFINHIEHLSQAASLDEYEYDMLRECIRLVRFHRHQKTAYPVTQIIQYINSNPTEKINLTTLSRLTGKSPDYLSRLFKREMGENITYYIHLRKVEAARYYLEHTVMKVTEVAAFLEFSNPAHFARVFRQFTGTSPSFYMRQASGYHAARDIHKAREGSGPD